jgi:HK97 gp10 family phage protein
MIKVSNIKLDTAALDKFAANLGMSTDRALAAIAHQVEGYAKQSSPIDTGALRNSINTEKKSENEYWVQDGVEYGIFQELGTSKMAAHPFMVPAMETASRIVAQEVEKALK